MQRLYYTAPSEEIFNEVKEKAIIIWGRYASNYASEKISYITPLENIQDNVMTIIGMFDEHNQERLANMLSNETREAIRIRMIDGSMPEEYIYF